MNSNYCLVQCLLALDRMASVCRSLSHFKGLLRLTLLYCHSLCGLCRRLLLPLLSMESMELCFVQRLSMPSERHKRKEDVDQRNIHKHPPLEVESLSIQPANSRRLLCGQVLYLVRGSSGKRGARGTNDLG